MTIDTWRWDYLGASGEGKVATPNLDRLAREGCYEREAVTPCPLTTPAHASILTGVNPTRHGIWDCTMYTLPGGIPTLAEKFRDAGFSTAAFLASETLNRRYGLDRGFEVYDDVAIPTGKGRDWWAACRDGAVVTEAFLAYLKERRPGERLFAWVHYYDAHLPYRPRENYDRQYPNAPYAAQVAYIDAQVGRLLSALHEKGGEWRVVVVGDHGEGLGDRNEATHGMGLYRSTLHVPLIVHPKPEKPLSHPLPWGLVDLAPTLSEWYGLPDGPVRGDGEALFESGDSGRALYSASLLPTLFFGVPPSLGVRKGNLFYMRYSSEELYDLSADPGQSRNLTGKLGHPQLPSLRALGNEEWPEGWHSKVVPTAPQPSSVELENLRSLGYISGGLPAAGKLRRVEVGQVLQDHSNWEAAREEAQATGRNDRLLGLLALLVERYPDSFALRKDYGTYLGMVGRGPEAILQLEKATRLFPRDSLVLENLGALYLAQGKAEAALAVLQRSVAINPNRAGAQKNLGILYLDYFKDPDRAVPHFRRYLEAGGDAEAAQIRAFIADRESGVARKVR